MLALRSRRTGPGSIVGSPVAEVVVVQVDEIFRSRPGGKLCFRRYTEKKKKEEWREKRRGRQHQGCSKVIREGISEQHHVIVGKTVNQ